MRSASPFQRDDLEHLDEVLGRARQVVPMLDVALGITDRYMIGMRHDVDNRIEPAVAFAEWENERGYRSTYFLLHSAPYWQDKSLLFESVQRIAELGHEIGLHNDAIAEAVCTGRDPIDILTEARDELNSMSPRVVAGTVAHGNRLCYGEDGKVRFVNDEIFLECSRPALGRADRVVAGVHLRSVPLASLGFLYDANWLPRSAYLSDSGGQWSGEGFEKVTDGFPYPDQLHMLVHPDWWAQAFTRVTA
jgi:hypothetical protein